MVTDEGREFSAATGRKVEGFLGGAACMLGMIKKEGTFLNDSHFAVLNIRYTGASPVSSFYVI